jgi:predicted Zn-ribbon and HTH transcriptional regulator
MTSSTCEYCNYEWETRVENPKACPRCKRRFDYDKIEENTEEVE